MNRHPEPPPPRRSASQLERLAQLPDRAHVTWRRLDDHEKNHVLNGMTRHYGTWFATRFLGLTQNRFKPSQQETMRIGRQSPEKLTAAGYERFNGNIWVNPEGDYYQRLTDHANAPRPNLPQTRDPAQPTEASKRLDALSDELDEAADDLTQQLGRTNWTKKPSFGNDLQLKLSMPESPTTGDTPTDPSPETDE